MARHLQRFTTLVVGWTLIALGVLGLFLPVLQGVLFLSLGLYVLSREAHWARRLLERLRSRFPEVDRATRALKERLRRRRQRQRVGVGRVRGPRRLLYVAGAVVVAVVGLELLSRGLEPVLEWVLSMRASGPQYPVATNEVPVFVLDRQAEHYIRSEHHWIPRDQKFLAVKPANGFRVFCLGGSAAMGWPHHPRSSYPSLLAMMLQKVLPETRVEVLNVAGNSYGSHRVRAVFEEIRGYQPDLVIVYSGNNEFVEEVVLGRSQAASADASRSAFVRLVHRASTPSRRAPPEFDVAAFGPEQLTANRVAVAFGWPSRLRQSHEHLRQVVGSYRSNIDAIVHGCQESGIDVLLLAVPVNLKEWIPVASVHRTDWSEVEAERWQAAYREGVLALERGDLEAATGSLSRATALDPGHAETWFHLGTVLHRQGRLVEARASFERALRQDAFPVRSVFNHVLFQIAQHRGVGLLDLNAVLEATTEDGLLGLDALVDYVHPTVVSNEIIAHQILSCIAGIGVLPGEPAVPVAAARVAVPEGVEDELWTLRGLFGQYLVMRQYDGLEDIAGRIHAAVDDWEPELDARAMADLDGLLAKIDATMEVVARYRRLLRAQKLGIVEQELSDADVQQILGEYTEMVRTTEGHFLSEAEFRNLVLERGGEMRAILAAP